MTRHLLCCLLMGGAFAQTPDALRKHVAYLASDELKGRNIPSPGLDAAADYIAAQFKEIGLEPAGNDHYFQTYDRALIKPDLTDFKFSIQNGAQTIDVRLTETLLFSNAAMTLEDVEIVKVDPENGAWLKALKPQDIKGKVLAIGIVSAAEGDEKQANFGDALALVARLDPALILMYGPTAAALDVPGVLIEPGQAQPLQRPRFPIRTDAFRSLIGPMPAGPTRLRVTLHLRQPIQQPVKLRNVAGMLRGSDPKLKDTYTVVTANFEGFPTRRIGNDPISNSANTNGSGVAALIETARSLASAGSRPKRSILFLATSGEPPDGPGPKYYREHPIVPIEKTAACLSLTQLGRTDTSDGPKLSSAAITGFKRSTIPSLFKTAAEPVGVSIYEDKARDAETGRGFQPLLLDKGVPSHTIYVAYSYPDARRVSDEANKLDYVNMAKVTRAIAAGLLAASDATH